MTLLTPHEQQTQRQRHQEQSNCSEPPAACVSDVLLLSASYVHELYEAVAQQPVSRTLVEKPQQRAYISRRGSSSELSVCVLGALASLTRSKTDPLSTRRRRPLFLQEPPCFVALLMRQLLAQVVFLPAAAPAARELCSIFDACAVGVARVADGGRNKIDHCAVAAPQPTF
ncbi:hypothetical protein Esti_006540 [Eimeria stiedai]